jgi:hypothetical protein
MRTREGHVLTGNNPEEIVASLHRYSFEKHANDRAYMLEVQRRVPIQTGDHIRADTAANFIDDLLAAGLLVDR